MKQHTEADNGNGSKEIHGCRVYPLLEKIRKMFRDHHERSVAHTYKTLLF